MSSWNDFTSLISRQVKGVGSSFSQTKDLAGRLIGGGAETPEQVAREKQFNDNLREAITKVGNTPIIGKPIAKAGDLLLKSAIQLNDKIISPLITRPMSTLALLTDTDSPLYKKGEHEEGFQLSDIKDAYNRSAKVSTMQALTRSNLIPLVGSVSGLVLKTGGINRDDIDLWNDESIKKNFVENDIGRWFTGIGDFTLANFGIVGVGKLAKVPLLFGATKAGLYTKSKTIDEFGKDLYTPGTVANSHMQTLANSKDIGEIAGIVEKYSTNENLISILYETKSVQAAADIILADKGDLRAMERLAKTAPSDLFELSGTAQHLANTFITTGRTYVPIAEAAVQRLKSAFDHAITKDVQFTKIREAFLDDSYNPLVGGRAYMPMEPVIGASALIKTEKAIRSVKSNLRFREDINFRAGSILETTIGGFTRTRLFKFSMRQGENMPQGFISFSGSRANQAREELNDFLNSIKLFNDGSKKITTSLVGGKEVKEKVADIRRRMEIEFVQSGTGVKQLEVLEKIDAEIGRLIMYDKKIFGEDTIANYTSNYRNNITNNMKEFQRVGYAIDHTGHRIETNPKTLSQLKDSYRFTPWDDIERQLNLEAAAKSGYIKYGAIKTAHNARATLDAINRVWSFDVLARPMFAIKQSTLEPLISAGLAQGMDIIWKYTVPMTIRLTHNTLNSAKEAASRVHSGPNLKAIRKNIDIQQEKFSRISAIKDQLQTEVENILKGQGSPAAAKSGLAMARKNLEAADALLDDIELGLRNSVKKYGVQEAMPSLTMLERRLAYIKKNPSKLTAQGRADIVNAQAAIDGYKLTIHNMATNKKVIQDADARLAAEYDKIDKLVKEQGKLFTERANVYGKSAKYKERYYDKATHDIVVDGQVITIDSFIAGNSPYATAMRAEVANTISAENTFLKELSVGTRQGVITRKVPGEPIRTSNPLYFEELAYLANRHFRNDPLMNLILQNKTLRELEIWASRQEGISYLKEFDIVNPAMASSYIQDKVALMDRMFPSATARAAIVKGEVTSNDLEKALSNYTDQLFDIHPTSYDYGVVDGIGHKSFNQMLDNTMSSVFKYLLKPENPIREMYFNAIANKMIAPKIATLMAQGVKMTPGRLNALRQASVREAIQDTEKTFYTVNRQSRLMKNARLVAAFPNATMNAFIRYGRIAVNNPIRTAQAVSGYGRGFMTFGVDENGNKTDDFNQITHIVVPGSKELGEHFNNLGMSTDGFSLNAKSIGFLLNNPSPSWLVGFSLGTIMVNFPDSEEKIKDAIDSVVPGTYDIWFPYGPPSDLKNMFITPYQKALWLGLTGPEGQKDYLASWNSVYNYHKTMNDLGIETTFPTAEQLRTETKSLWMQKFYFSFASPFGVPIKANTNPMGLAGALYYKARDKAFSEGKTIEEANNIAANQMLSTLGPKFMTDRVSFSGSSKNLNIPQTQEAYARIFVDNDALVKTLAGIDKDSISIVSLLVSDLSNDPAERSDIITRILSDPDLVLKGTSRAINDLKMTPEEVEIERIKSRTWTTFNLVKDALTAKITDGKSMRSHPELQAALSTISETILKKESPAWYSDYMYAKFGDKSYKYAKGLNAIINDTTFMKANGNTPFWKDVKTFMHIRDMFVTAYQALPDYDPRKAKLMDGYNSVTELYAPQWDPKLQQIIKFSFDNDTLKAVN